MRRNGAFAGSYMINCVLGIQYLDSWRACTLFLLLRRLSSEEAVSTRLKHNLGCNKTDEFPRRLSLILEATVRTAIFKSQRPILNAVKPIQKDR